MTGHGKEECPPTSSSAAHLAVTTPLPPIAKAGKTRHRHNGALYNNSGKSIIFGKIFGL